VTANIAIADSLKALDFNRPNREEPSKRVNVSGRGDDEGNPLRWALMAPARSIPIDSRANGAGLSKTRKRGKLANDPAAIR